MAGVSTLRAGGSVSAAAAAWGWRHALGLVLFAGLALLAGCDDPEEQIPPAATAAPPAGDWKTYADPGARYSLEYPPDLEIQDLTGGGSGGLVVLALDFRAPEDPLRAFTLAVYENPEGFSAEEWLVDSTVCVPGTIQAGAPVDGLSSTACVSEPAGRPEAALAVADSANVVFISSILPAPEFERVVASLRLPPSQ